MGPQLGPVRQDTGEHMIALLPLLSSRLVKIQPNVTVWINIAPRSSPAV